MDFERRRRHTHEINLTALIDIVFHLLVFVMLTTSFVVSESMELSLPSGQVIAPPPANIARIQIYPDGQLDVNGTLMNDDGLNAYLANALANDPRMPIAIFTTPSVSVQQLINVMDTVYLTGGSNVQVDRII